MTVHYKGTLVDGTEFDSSHTRGRPAKFPVKGVIAGWTEALQLMPVGSTYRLFVPSDLAYGEQGDLPRTLVAPRLDRDLRQHQPTATDSTRCNPRGSIFPRRPRSPW